MARRQADRPFAAAQGDKTGPSVMLSATKHLSAHPDRPFAEFTLSDANGLRVTRQGHAGQDKQKEILSCYGEGKEESRGDEEEKAAIAIACGKSSWHSAMTTGLRMGWASASSLLMAM